MNLTSWSPIKLLYRIHVSLNFGKNVLIEFKKKRSSIWKRTWKIQCVTISEIKNGSAKGIIGRLPIGPNQLIEQLIHNFSFDRECMRN